MSMLKLSALPLAAFMGAAIWGAAAMVPFAPGPDEMGSTPKSRTVWKGLKTSGPA